MKKYLVIGNPIEHSLSPLLHNYWIKKKNTSTLYKDLSKRFKLDINKKIKELSKGNKQKVGIIQAFMKDSNLLILDEPTSGLDPNYQREFRELIFK